jgi:hypothetical protein
MVSVGTGLGSRRHGHARGLKATAGAFAAAALMSVMDDCNDDVETLMQWVSRSPTARRIDGQTGDLSGDLLSNEPLLSYLRYNVVLESEWLAKHLEVDRDQPDLDTLARMDQPANMPALAELGKEAAEKQIRSEHFTAAFDRK